MPVRTAYWPETACPRVSSIAWAPLSFTGAPCAAACAAKRGRGLTAPCPDARPNLPRPPSSIWSGATTRPLPTFISSVASANQSLLAAGGRLTEREILALVRWLADIEPLVLSPGNGLERGRNGGSAVRAAIALPALLGKLGNGNGIVLGASNAFPKTPNRLQRPDLIPDGTRTLNINDIGRHLAESDVDPPLRGLFIYNHNPIVVHPDQNRMRRGLAR